MSDVALTVTDACAARVGAALAAESTADASAGLRVDVVAGGCSGYQYRLSLDRDGKGDVVVEAGGVRVIVDAEHVPYVRGATIDFRTEAGVTGFRVDNPNIIYGCGCGSSFLLRDEERAVGLNA